MLGSWLLFSQFVHCYKYPSEQKEIPSVRPNINENVSYTDIGILHVKNISQDVEVCFTGHYTVLIVKHAVLVNQRSTILALVGCYFFINHHRKLIMVCNQYRL